MPQNQNQSMSAAGSFVNTLFRHIKKANENAVRDLIYKHYKLEKKLENFDAENDNENENR